MFFFHTYSDGFILSRVESDDRDSPWPEAAFISSQGPMQKETLLRLIADSFHNPDDNPFDLDVVADWISSEDPVLAILWTD